MLKLISVFFFFCLIFDANADNKKKIIKNLENTYSLSFKFEQNINGKTENGNCKVQYPKKIYCEYNKYNNEILVSNGKSLVIKTITSYYRYPIEKTPLNIILDKKLLINKINSSKEKLITNSYINFTIVENDLKIDVFFDLNTFNIIGWETIDIYQNKVITLLYYVKKNQDFKKNIFELPDLN
tara:strand:- start:620 stop:1168 length:549 start_codon:yes stop_codon:yes gene_type:complete